MIPFKIVVYAITLLAIVLYSADLQISFAPFKISVADPYSGLAVFSILCFLLFTELSYNQKLQKAKRKSYANGVLATTVNNLHGNNPCNAHWYVEQTRPNFFRVKCEVCEASVENGSTPICRKNLGTPVKA